MTETNSKKETKLYFYHYIINSIKQNSILPKDYSKQRLNYYVRGLKLNGLIEMIGKGVWKLTSLGEQFIVKKIEYSALVQPNILKSKKVKKQTNSYIRGHGFMWKLKIPLIKDKLSMYSRLKKHNATFTKTKMIKLYIYGHNVRVGSRAVLFNLDKNICFNGNSAKESYMLAVYELKRTILRLENILGYSLKVKKKHWFKSCKKHFGDVNNEIAKEYRKKGESISIKDNSKEWLVIDFSDGTYEELETTDNDRNIVDMDNCITPFMNFLRHNPKFYEEIDKEIHSQRDAFQKITLSINDLYKLQAEMYAFVRDNLRK